MIDTSNKEVQSHFDFIAAGAAGDVERLGGRPPKPLRDVLAGALKPPSA